jgi:hypothetical protein
VNWFALLFALATGVPAVILLFVHPIPKLKLPAAILLGLSFLGLLATFAAVRNWLDHLAGTPLGLAILGGGAIGAVLWVLLEFFIRAPANGDTDPDTGELKKGPRLHTVALYGRMDKNGQPKPGHPLRPAIALMAMALMVVLAAANIHTLSHGFGKGASTSFSQLGGH